MKNSRTLYERFDDLCQKYGDVPICEAPIYCKPRQVSEESRELEFVLSTAGIKRDGWEIRQEGWILSDFRKNPIVLWAHNDKSPPIATSVKEWLAGSKKMGKHLRGIARFLTENKNPFAEQAYQMYRDGDLSAVSVRWKPMKHERIMDEEYEALGLEPPLWGGIRFLEQVLLEYSGVPIPADPDALIVRARSMPKEFGSKLVLPRAPSEVELEKGKVGLIRLDGHEVNGETRSYFDMASGGADPDVEEQEAPPAVVEEVPLQDKQPPAADEPPEAGVRAVVPYMKTPVAPRGKRWDGAAAARRVARWASSDGSGAKDKMDWGKYRQAFLWYDPERQENFSSYKGPHHDVIDGRLRVVRSGVIAAAQRLMQGAFDVPEGDYPAMREHLGKEYANLGEVAPWDRALGRLYEQIHVQLRDGFSTDQREARHLHEMAVLTGRELFGDDAVREPFEHAWWKKSDDLASRIACILDVGCEEVIEDRLVREDHVECLMAEVRPLIEDEARRHAARIEEIARRLSVPVDGIDERIEKLLSGSLPGGDAGTAEKLKSIRESLDALRGNAKTEAAPADGSVRSIRSMIDEILRQGATAK